MNEVDKLRERYKPLSGTAVPDGTRARINAMIDRYEPVSVRPQVNRKSEIFRTTGAMAAAVAVVCFVVLRVTNQLHAFATEGAGLTSVAQGSARILLPYIVLLGTSVAVWLIAWFLRKGLLGLAYRYRGFQWLSGQRIGIRLYDSERLQTYTAVLFSWVMFAIFVAPSTTSPWIGVIAFLLFCGLCGSVRYLLFATFAVLVIAVPAWYITVLPSGPLSGWSTMIVLNIAFFILTPGMILIPVRNALLRRYKTSGRGEMR